MRGMAHLVIVRGMLENKEHLPDLEQLECVQLLWRVQSDHSNARLLVQLVSEVLEGWTPTVRTQSGKGSEYCGMVPASRERH